MNAPVDNVVSIHGGPVIQKVRRDDVVEELEEMLEMARSGEIVGFAGAILYHDAATGVRRAGLATRALIGAIETAKFHLLSESEQ